MDYFQNSFMDTIIISMKRVKGAERYAPFPPTDRGLAETPLLRPILQVSLTLKNCALWYRNIFPHLPNNI